MKSMSEYTRVGPDARVRKLKAFNDRLARTPESINVFREWQMELDSNLVEFSARELPMEYIVFDGGNVLTDKFGEWNSAFRSCKLFNVQNLTRWHLISPSRNMDQAKEFINCVVDAGRGMGFGISKPTCYTINDDRGPTYVSALEQVANSDPQLIMCIVPNNRSDR